MGTYAQQVYLEQAGTIRVGYLPQGCTKTFMVEIMFEVVSTMMSADKLNTTVDGPMTNERNTASSRIGECTPKSIFRKSIKNIDSSNRMNLANSLRVQTPDLVYFRDPTIQTDNVLEEVAASLPGLRTKTESGNPSLEKLGQWRLMTRFKR